MVVDVLERMLLASAALSRAALQACGRSNCGEVIAAVLAPALLPSPRVE
jgi:hypothetical protein